MAQPGCECALRLAADIRVARRVLPAVCPKERGQRSGLVVCMFQDQPSGSPQPVRGFLDDPAQGFEPRGTRDETLARLKTDAIGLERGIVIRKIGGVRYDPVEREAPGQRFKPVSIAKNNRRGLEYAGILAGLGQGFTALIRGPDFKSGTLAGERDREHTASGAEIEQPARVTFGNEL